MRKTKILLTITTIFLSITLLKAQQWSLTGNSGTTPGTNFLGTTDAKDLVFKTNNIERMRLTGASGSEGSLCLGVSAPYSTNTKLTLVGSISSGSIGYILTEMRTLYPFNDGHMSLLLNDFRVIDDAHIIKASDYRTGTGITRNIFDVTNKGKTIIGNTSSTGIMLEIPAGSINFGFSTFPTTSLAGGYRLGISGNANINGSLVIGTTSSFTAGTPFPTGYKLYVADGILTEKLKVSPKTTADWADYVFDKKYELRTLTEVEKFINENKHLPGVPSAQEVVDNGIDVAKMDAKLLEKIEELTLYVIQLQKQIDELKK